MTENEIIKALKCCEYTDELLCYMCPEIKDGECIQRLHTMALDLISRQRTEIEELHSDKIIAETHERAAKDLFKDCVKQLDGVREENKRLLQKLQQAKSEAIKEFARELKCGVPQETGVIRCKDIDDLVKQMTEVKENEKQ